MVRNESDSLILMEGQTMENTMEDQQLLETKSDSVGVRSEEADTLQQKCLEFAQTLGLQEPVSVQVLEAAVRDETYARNLLASRRTPSTLTFLLARPPRPRSPNSAPRQHANGELIRRAAVALLRWGKVGFSVVDRATLERRRAACLSCDHLIDPPDRLVYQLAAAADNKKICDLCGCSAWKKTKLPTESCPVRHPDRDSMSRWGEPWQAGQGEAP